MDLKVRNIQKCIIKEVFPFQPMYCFPSPNHFHQNVPPPPTGMSPY